MVRFRTSAGSSRGRPPFPLFLLALDFSSMRTS
jgi:hypothetical protein